MIHSACIRWVLGLALAVGGPMVNAAVVTYSFSGTISSIQDSQSYAVSSVQIGQSFSATLRYDTNLATGSGSGVQTDYTFSAGGYEFSVAIGPAATPLYAGTAESTSSSVGGRVSILDNFSGPPQDWFQTRSSAADGFSAPSIDGFTWRQTDITLKDYSGTLYSGTALPNEIAALNNFEEAFSTLTLSRPNPTNTGTEFAIIGGSISSIQAVLSTLDKVDVLAGEVEAVLGATQPGALEVVAPSSGTFSATYNQQAVTEVDFSTFNFFIPGSIFQVWDLDFSGNIEEGEFVEIVFRYDDTGMTVFQELLLDIFHEVSPGIFERLLGVVDTDANTITARTSSFSPFVLGEATVTNDMPAPGTLWLTAVALAALGSAYRRRLRCRSDLR